MSYFSIRKRRKLQYLPPANPVLERAGSSDGDARLEASRRWIEEYHRERAAFQQERRDGKTEQGEEARGTWSEGLGDAPGEGR